MPLIQCPDCNTDISDKAKICIKCGYPIQQLSQEIIIDQEIMIDTELENTVADIGNARDFNIHQQIANWSGNGVLKNITSQIEKGDLGSLCSGDFIFYRHKSGVRIRNKSNGNDSYDVNYRQIIDITETTAEEMVQKNKSIIGRGIAGGLLLGPAAAVVGALSAMNTTSLKKLTIIKFSFCDPVTLARRDVYFKVPQGSSALFVLNTQNEMNKVRPNYQRVFMERSIEHIERLSPKHAAKMRIELDKKMNE